MPPAISVSKNGVFESAAGMWPASREGRYRVSPSSQASLISDNLISRSARKIASGGAFTMMAIWSRIERHEQRRRTLERWESASDATSMPRPTEASETHEPCRSRSARGQRKMDMPPPSTRRACGIIPIDVRNNAVDTPDFRHRQARVARPISREARPSTGAPLHQWHPNCFCTGRVGVRRTCDCPSPEKSSSICLLPTTARCGQPSSRCGWRLSWRSCGCCRRRVLATAGSVASWLRTGRGPRSRITSRSSRASIRRRGCLRRCLSCRRRSSSGSVSSGANCHSHRAARRGPRLRGSWSGMRSLYPAINAVQHASVARIPTFGLPCPTTILTGGLLLLASPRLRILAIVPVIWSAIGGSAAFLLGVSADYALPVTGVALTVFELQKSDTSLSGPALNPGRPAAR